MITIPTYPPVPPSDSTNKQPNLAKIQTNYAAEGSVIPVVYGPFQIGGKPIHINYNAGTNTWTVAFLVCLGEIQAIDAIWINGAAPVSGVVTASYTGTTSQTANSTMSTAEGSYSETYAGIAYVVVQWTNTHYPGFPSVVIEGRGRKVVTNLITGVREYSVTPAWHWFDFVNDIANLANNNTLAVALNTLALSNTETVTSEARRESGIVIDVARPPGEWIEILALYASAFVSKRPGYYYPIPDRPGSVARTLTSDDFLEQGFEVVIADSADIPNAVHILYSDTTLDLWTEAEAVSIDPSAGTLSNPQRDSYVRMPGVTRYSQAVREARERREKLAVGSVSLRAVLIDRHMDLEEGDLISVTDRALGPSAVTMRITSRRVLSIGRLQIEASKYSAAVYDNSEDTFSGLTRPKVIGEQT